jgi:hypothetical protein
MAKKAAETTSQAATQSVTKSEAVRRAIAAGKAMPNEGVAYIKETFGLDLSPAHFSNIKSTTGGKKKRPGRPKGSKNMAKADEIVAAAPRAAARANAAIDIEAIQQVKELVKTLGMPTVKTLVDMVS